LAQVACVYLRQDSPRPVAAFTVHAKYMAQTSLMGLEVVPFETLYQSHPPSEYDMFVAVGYKRLNQAREEIYRECKSLGYELISYVNSRACTWGELEIGDNCFVFEQNVLQPFVKIGNNVILWSGNHVGHHARIDDHCFIASHAVISGHVEIGSHCFIGVNSTFRDGVKVAARNVIGAGAIITRDTLEDEVYAPEATSASKVKSSRLPAFR
jgi:sugar O-acyltransferase (sialic acid O-acetyltransferase NeuD family)